MTVIENVQNALDDMGAVCKVVVHLDSRVSDVILQEALALMVAIKVSSTCGNMNLSWFTIVQCSHILLQMPPNFVPTVTCI